MIDIRIKESSNLLDQTCVRSSVRLNRSSCVHSGICQSIHHFVVDAIMISPAGDIDIVSDGAYFGETPHQVQLGACVEFVESEVAKAQAQYPQ